MRIRNMALVGGAIAASSAALATAVGAWPNDPAQLTGVPAANTKSDGYAPDSVLSPELRQVVAAQGSTRLENPSALTSYYGYDSDLLNAAGRPQMLPTPGANPAEAQKTEP